MLFIISCSAQQNVAHDTVENVRQLDSIDVSVIEKSLNVIEFKQYLHLEIPARRVISFSTSCSLKPDGIEHFMLFSEVVTIVTKDPGHDSNLIRLIKLTQSENKITLVFDYKVEGVTLAVVMSKKDNDYEVLNYRIIER